MSHQVPGEPPVPEAEPGPVQTTLLPRSPGASAAGTQRKSPGFSVMLYCEALAKGQPPDTKNDGGHLNR